jgi:hypothetical protein
VLNIVLAAAALLTGLAALAWAAFLSVRLSTWRTRYDALTHGVEGEALEALLRRYIAVAGATRDQVDALADEHRDLVSRLETAVQRVGLVRFDAFEDSGGRQSFALALLDHNNDGTVLSALYHRDACRVYARPVASGRAVSGGQLGDEEQEAIRRAQGPLSQAVRTSRG